VTWTLSAYVRLVLLAVGAVVLQVSGVAQFHILGATADITPLVVGAVALLTGSVPGAVMGFWVGLLLDLSLGQRLGVTSLVLAPAGYAVGRYQELREPSMRVVALRLGAAISVFYVAAVGAVNFIIEPGITVSPLTVRSMAVTVVLNTIVAGPVFWLCHLWLRRALAFDPFEYRRRRRWRSRRSGALRLRRIGV
jgi:rod shape-determining protein MreD